MAGRGALPSLTAGEAGEDPNRDDDSEETEDPNRDDDSEETEEIEVGDPRDGP